VNIRKEVILLDTFYIDNLADAELMYNKLHYYLRKVKPARRRIVIEILTEPVIQLEGGK